MTREPSGTAADASATQVHGPLPDAAFLETLPAGFVAMGDDWRVTYVNRAAEELLGRPREAMVGRGLWDLFPWAAGSQLEETLRGVLATGVPVTFTARRPARGEWYEVRAARGPHGLSIYLLDVTSRYALQEHTQRTARRVLLIARLAADLVGSLDVRETAQRTARALVPALGDWAVVSTVRLDELGAIEGMVDVGWWHPDPARRPLVEAYARGRLTALRDESAFTRALATGELVTVPSGAAASIRAGLAPGPARDAVTALAPGSGTVLPLRASDRTVGAITLLNDEGRPPLDGEDLEVAREVADRVALALDNAYLYHRQRRVAEVLQRSMLTDPPGVDGLDVAVRYVPAAETAHVGGDWYDVVARAQDTVVVIGDVTGHDLQSAALMGQLRWMLRGIAVTTGSGPAQVLTEVDRAMAALGYPTLATAVVASVDTRAAPVRLRWSNAGHPPPVVVDAGGEVRVLSGSDLLLGTGSTERRTESEVALEPGATLLLYTDGLVERRREGVLAGVRRLADVLGTVAGLDVEPLADAVLGRLVPDAPQDDVALVAVRARAATAR